MTNWTAEDSEGGRGKMISRKGAEAQRGEGMWPDNLNDSPASGEDREGKEEVMYGVFPDPT
jgi:hypothetical protein